jgi:pimeloyl-ACP methyl ester carboxylesterase
MERATFEAAVPGGRLCGWIAGDGPPVLLLHGGPGMSFDYLDSIAGELLPAFRVASYQQRGLAPSTLEGPFAVEREVADAVAVLAALGWERAWIVGHSWGGHLLLHLAVAVPERFHGGLAVDPLGGAGDGGTAEFEAEMARRTPAADRRRAQELDERAMRGERTEEEAQESLRLFWPAYFADPARTLAFPTLPMSLPAYAGVWESINAELPRLSEALGRVTVPLGFLAGAESPMPVAGAAGATAAAVPGAWLEVVDGAGHFPWFERPGCVRAALERLGARPAATAIR